MGAPKSNAAGRPMRRAAQLAINAKPWLNCISVSNIVKCPWIQEDSDDDEEDAKDITTFQLRRADLRMREQEDFLLAMANLWDQASVATEEEETSEDTGSEASAVTPGLSWDDEFDESELPSADTAQESDSSLTSVSDIAVPSLNHQPYSGPALADWVPRHLSSEYTNQLEVNHLPTSSGTDAAYFLTDAVFGSDQEQAEMSNPLTEHSSSEDDETPVNSSPDLGDISHPQQSICSVPSGFPSEDDTFTAAQSAETDPQLGTRTAGGSAPTRTTPRSRIPVRTPPPRQSARLSRQPRRDYKSLHHRGGGPRHQ